jgi:hypothetical protein
MGSVRKAVFLGLVCALVSAAGGCRQTAAKPVNVSLARDTLAKALDAWKAGKKPADLQAGTPSIVVQDPDWTAGTKLTSYEVVGPGTALNANLNCQVKLVLATADGQAEEKTVTYVVGTDPVLTVFRDLFQ